VIEGDVLHVNAVAEFDLIAAIYNGDGITRGDVWRKISPQRAACLPDC
jgi:hypothetical protein